MSNHNPEPAETHDQDAEPSLNSPEEGRPDGITDEAAPDDEESGPAGDGD